jgi:hypothetical protein
MPTSGPLMSGSIKSSWPDQRETVLAAGYGPFLNVVFHDVVAGGTPDGFVLPRTFLESICAQIADLNLAHRTRIYFDDGHVTALTQALPVLRGYAGIQPVIAMPTAAVGLPGFLTVSALDVLAAEGWTISPHGFHHVRLASYDEDGSVLGTPFGGPYGERTSETHSRPLCENEVLFEFVAAGENLARYRPREFVLPYGAYNNDVVAINDRHGLFETLATADPGWDRGQHLRPRLLLHEGLIDRPLADLVIDLAY